jgi:ubiquinone biosynthesis protein UbiJ
MAVWDLPPHEEAILQYLSEHYSKNEPNGPVRQYIKDAFAAVEDHVSCLEKRIKELERQRSVSTHRRGR